MYFFYMYATYAHVPESNSVLYIFHGLLLLRARWVNSVAQGPAEDDRILDAFFFLSAGEKHFF